MEPSDSLEEKEELEEPEEHEGVDEVDGFDEVVEELASNEKLKAVKDFIFAFFKSFRDVIMLKVTSLFTTSHN